MNVDNAYLLNFLRWITAYLEDAPDVNTRRAVLLVIRLVADQSPLLGEEAQKCESYRKAEEAVGKLVRGYLVK